MSVNRFDSTFIGLMIRTDWNDEPLQVELSQVDCYQRFIYRNITGMKQIQS